MTGTGAETTNAVPQSAWVLGWACLAGEVASLIERGATNADSALLSVPLSALVVGWISHGVLRARMIRLWFAGAILMLTSLFGLVALVADPSSFALIAAATGLVAFVALVVYTQTDCFARLREDKQWAGPAFGGLVAIALVVGALGGLAAEPGPNGRQNGFHVRIGL